MEENKSDWLTVGEVADELGFSRTTVYGWLEDGLLVGHRIAGSWRVKRHDLDAFIAAGRNVPQRPGVPGWPVHPVCEVTP